MGEVVLRRLQLWRSYARPRLAVSLRDMPRNALVAAASDPGGQNHRKPKLRCYLEAVAHLVHGVFVTPSGTDLIFASLAGRYWCSPWLRTRQRESVAEVCGGRHQRTGGQRATSPRNSHFSTTTYAGRCHLGVRFTAQLPYARDGPERSHSRSGRRSWLCRRHGHRKTCSLQARLGLVAARTSWMGPVEFCGTSKSALLA